MISNKIHTTIPALLKTAGYHEPFELSPMSGGGNNRVFLIRRNEQVIGVFKEYYHHAENLRDRLVSEWVFSKFLWEKNIRQIPEPLISDPVNHIAFYRFIDGNKLTPETITKDHIDQVIGFYYSINSFRQSDDARQLLDAQESCFSLNEHIRLTDKRIENLKSITGQSQTDMKARLFIKNELLPMWDAVRNAICSSAVEQNSPLEKVTPLADRRLSPSDFGFHNILEDRRGRLFFMDFEYAGWDDPAKTVCDFFCQPAIPVPPHFFPYIIEKIVENFNEPDVQRRRIELLLPVYQIKWCCIILNEFLPLGKSRRLFMNNINDSETIKKIQIHRAMDVIHNLSFNP
jgi:thiamine kinase-like enzyme